MPVCICRIEAPCFRCSLTLYIGRMWHSNYCHTFTLDEAISFSLCWLVGRTDEKNERTVGLLVGRLVGRFQWYRHIRERVNNVSFACFVAVSSLLAWLLACFFPSRCTRKSKWKLICERNRWRVKKLTTTTTTTTKTTTTAIEKIYAAHNKKLCNVFVISNHYCEAKQAGRL